MAKENRRHARPPEACLSFLKQPTRIMRTRFDDIVIPQKIPTKQTWEVETGSGDRENVPSYLVNEADCYGIMWAGYWRCTTNVF